jgi:hypothetical protein
MRMLYKYPGPHEIHGDTFDYIIVAENAVDKHLAQGWFMTTTEAKATANLPCQGPEPEPEPDQVKPRSMTMLTDEEKAAISAEEEITLKGLMQKYNITYHAARNLRK